MKKLAAIAAMVSVIGVLTWLDHQQTTQPSKADLSWMDIYTMSQWTNPNKPPFEGCPHLMYFTNPPTGTTVKVENPTLWGDPMQQIKEDLDKAVLAHRNAVAAESRLHGHRIIE